MIEIKIDTAQVSAALARLSKAAVDASPVMAQIAGVMHDAVMENFEREGRPKWLGLKPSTLAQKRKKGYSDKPLIRRGGGRSLYSSITMQSDASSATVGTNIEYAAIHQFGGQAGRGRKTTIPARPYLKITEEDGDKIIGKVSAYLKSVIG